MQEQVITFKTFKLAKEKGFSNNKQVNKSIEREYIDHKGNGIGEYYYQNKIVDEDFIPTQSLLQKWLRERHNIIIDVLTIWDEKDLPLTNNNIAKPKEYVAWDFYNEEYNLENKMMFKTYEEALEHSLQNALKLITL